jgi:hypothetical protein
LRFFIEAVFVELFTKYSLGLLHDGQAFSAVAIVANTFLCPRYHPVPVDSRCEFAVPQ